MGARAVDGRSHDLACGDGGGNDSTLLSWRSHAELPRRAVPSAFEQLTERSERQENEPTLRQPSSLGRACPSNTSARPSYPRTRPASTCSRRSRPTVDEVCRRCGARPRGSSTLSRRQTPRFGKRTEHYARAAKRREAGAGRGSVHTRSTSAMKSGWRDRRTPRSCDSVRAHRRRTAGSRGTGRDGGRTADPERTPPRRAARFRGTRAATG